MDAPAIPAPDADSRPRRHAAFRGWRMIVLFLLPYPLVGAGWWYLQGGICAVPRCTQTNADFNSLSTSLEMFRINARRYPTTAEGLDALVHRPAGMPRWQQMLDAVPLDPWKRPYVYTRLNSHEFSIRSLGPDPKDPADDIVWP